MTDGLRPWFLGREECWGDREGFWISDAGRSRAGSRDGKCRGGSSSHSCIVCVIEIVCARLASPAEFQKGQILILGRLHPAFVDVSSMAAVPAQYMMPPCIFPLC